MRTPVVDYRKLRVSNLNSPEFSHLKLLLGWVGFFILYVLTERLIPAEKCTPIHCPLDDRIPFCEWFIIPYVGWYLLIIVSLVWFALYNIDHFRKLQTYIIVTQVTAMAAYILFPSRQDLRPDQFLNNNLLTGLVGLIYSLDTNTGVCPSLHVAYSLGIASTWLREKQAPWYWKMAIVIFATLICLSVTFVKQHSVVDILAAIPVCALAEWYAFYRNSGEKINSETFRNM